MYGDIQGMAVFELKLKTEFIMGPFDTVNPENSVFLLEFNKADYPEIAGLNSLRDVITGFNFSLSSGFNSLFIFQSPVISPTGSIQVNILSLASPNGGISILAGSIFRFAVVRERSHNSGAML